jgi:alpha-1,6-mannosyltransferase
MPDVSAFSWPKQAQPSGLARPAGGPAAAWGLLALGSGIGAIFVYFARERYLDSHIPEFIALSLAAGVLYLSAVYLVERFRPGASCLFIVLAGAVVFRLIVLPAAPPLSEDVYRYQWEGRAKRAMLNPYSVSPGSPGLAWLEDPQHPIRTGTSTPAIYPPLSELVFSWVTTVPGYKRLFTLLDLLSVLVLLLLLNVRGEPLSRVVTYAWNPGVVVSFALCGHHDSLAILTLLGANLFIIGGRPAMSIAFLGLATLSKLYPAWLLPVFLRRTRASLVAVFGGLVLLGYLPFATAGSRIFSGLGDFARGWESNDSLFRLLRLAGNTQAQAELISVTLLLGWVAYAVRKRWEPLRASLAVLAGLLFLSPDAFPWYFTWLVPFMCFFPEPPLLLASVVSVLGYAPVVAYSAGQPFRDSPLILALEYLPALVWLGIRGMRQSSLLNT